MYDFTDRPWADLLTMVIKQYRAHETAAESARSPMSIPRPYVPASTVAFGLIRLSELAIYLRGCAHRRASPTAVRRTG
jgi:hypothetical protein